MFQKFRTKGSPSQFTPSKHVPKFSFGKNFGQSFGKGFGKTGSFLSKTKADEEDDSADDSTDDKFKPFKAKKSKLKGMGGLY